MTLKELKTSESAVIEAVGGEGALRQHFLDMGVIPGAVVTLEKLAPMGDPMELRIHGYSLTLRLADADNITVRPVNAKAEAETKKKHKKKTSHPGLGEGGIFHAEGDGDPLPDDADICTCG